MICVCIVLVAFVGVLSAGEIESDAPTTDQVRAAVQRSIPYIEEQGAAWIKSKDCVSCHRVGNMVWSLTVARQQGFEVSDQLDEWLEWSVQSSFAHNEKGNVVGLGNKEGVAQLIFSLDDSADESSSRAELVALLSDAQRDDGSWKPGGQLPSQKRPANETTAVSAMWLALALLDAGENQQDAPALDGALKYIASSEPGVSTEYYAARLLLAVERDEADAREQFATRLQGGQRDDGGWGWLIDEESDALGTGLALFALMRAGVSREADAVKQAQQFLVDTQRDDGSWAVRGTKAKKKDRVQETASYWGTTWATLGLTASLPE